jgi:hypothetical protein
VKKFFIVWVVIIAILAALAIGVAGAVQLVANCPMAGPIIGIVAFLLITGLVAKSIAKDV